MREFSTPFADIACELLSRSTHPSDRKSKTDSHARSSLLIADTFMAIGDRLAFDEFRKAQRILRIVFFFTVKAEGKPVWLDEALSLQSAVTTLACADLSRFAGGFRPLPACGTEDTML